MLSRLASPGRTSAILRAFHSSSIHFQHRYATSAVHGEESAENVAADPASTVPDESVACSSAPCPVQPAERVEWTVNEEENYTRLDKFIKRRAPGLPPGFIQTLIRKGRITVDGEAPKRNAFPVEAYSVVGIPGDIKLGLTRRKRKPPEDDTTLAEQAEIRTWVLHRDARCVILNKPPGICTQSNGIEGERHVEALLPGIGGGRYWLVHRLDKEVSGTLVVARDVGAAALLAGHFKDRLVVKTYWALVRGKPVTQSGVITAPVDGKKALTKYAAVKYLDDIDCSWLNLQPRTGRKHQLRIHCATVLGTPIVGDLKYTPNVGFKQLVPQPQGLNLHAKRIEFPLLTKVHHGGAKPQLGRNPKPQVDVEAPLPDHMVQYWRTIGMLSENDKDEENNQDSYS